MRRGRIFIYIGLILILALVGAVFALQRLTGGGGTPEGGTPVVAPTEEPVTVVITTQRVPRGAEIGPEVVQLVSIPREFLIEGMFRSVEDVVGRRAKFDLDAQIYLTTGMLVDRAEDLSATGSNAALLIPRGMVAVSIPISRLSSVSYAVQPGDHVNVIATLLVVDLDTSFQTILPNNTAGVIAPGPNVIISSMGPADKTAEDAGTSALATGELLQNLTAQSVSGGSVSPAGRLELDPTLGQPFLVVPSEVQRGRLVSQNLIQNVVVLHVGNFPLDQNVAAAPTPEGTPAAEATPVPVEEQAVVAAPEVPDVITLIVSPQDAITLNYLMYSGAELTLALRSAQDDSRADTEAVTLQFLLDQYNIPIPAKLPFGVQPGIYELVPPVLKNDIPTPPPQ